MVFNSSLPEERQLCASKLFLWALTPKMLLDSIELSMYAKSMYFPFLLQQKKNALIFQHS